LKRDEELRSITLTRARLELETKAANVLLQERKVEQMRLKEEEDRSAGEVCMHI
jgi:hypothetical protein